MIKKLLLKLKQKLCKHHWKCVYIYHVTADWKCKKCNKRKKGMAPIGISNKDLNSKWYKNEQKKFKWCLYFS